MESHGRPPWGIGTASPRRRLAESTSVIGAGVLGAGIALLFATSLAPYAVPLFVVGILLHAWGMFDRSRLDRAVGASTPRWATVLYWVCWLSLLALTGYIAATLLRA